MKREKYLKKIRPFYHDDLIKVITGIRRCGKSNLLLQIKEELIQSGVDNKQIIFIDLDSIIYKNCKTANQLEVEIDKLYKDHDKKTYLFIDEIQNIKNYEEIVNAYRTSYGTSIFITGSNSYLLSGELVTKLTGRYIEFPILPFSFSEAKDYLEQNNMGNHLDIENYILYGGLPKRFDYINEEQIFNYIKEITNQIITKDILIRARINNVSLFKKIIDYVCNNPATTFSSISITRYLKNEHINTKISTIKKYIDFIVNSKIINRCERYDIKGKKILNFEEKYYLSDLAFKTVLGRSNKISYSLSLENIVYNELISRGYDVYVGKFYNKEVDFVVKKNKEIAYIQVTYLMNDDDTIIREFTPLESIRDNYPKYVISLDPINMSNNGIKHLHLINGFLLSEAELK